jgi:Fe-S-cluster containining protein
MSPVAALPILASCDGCGACCRHMIVPPFVLSGGRNEAREKGVSEELLAELLPRWEVRFFVAEEACLWYDAATARCRHYDLRPDACRAFEINSPHCHASREKWGVAMTAIEPISRNALASGSDGNRGLTPSG